MREILQKWPLAFGLAWALSAPVAWAQRPGYREMGTASAATPKMLTHPDVRKDLKLTDAQVARIGAAINAGVTALKAVENETDRPQMGRDMRKAYNDAAKKILDLSPEQIRRYDQLIIQFRGIEGFYDPAVRNRIEMSDGQFRKFLEIGERAKVKAGELLKDNSGTREERIARFGALDKDVMAEVMALFSDKQKAAYQELLGAPIVLRPTPAKRP